MRRSWSRIGASVALGMSVLGMSVLGLSTACEPPVELAAPVPPHASPCEGVLTEAPPEVRERELAVTLTVADDVAADAVDRVVGDLGGYLARWHVSLQLQGASRRRIEPLLAAASADIAGASVEAADERLYGSLRGWIRESERAQRPGPARPGVELVIVRELAPPGTLADQLLGPLGGLTLTPEACQGEASVVCGDLASEGPFRPTVFLAVDAIDRLGDAGLWTGPHEVGHALGLSHVDSPGNLMTRSGVRCLPGLDAEQRARLSAALPAAR